MKFCSECGNPVQFKVPDGDNRERFVCVKCETIHYQNPKLVTGTIPVWQEKILMCKRGIEPRYGYWTLPAGFMENKETVEEAAKRETWEEALAKVTLSKLISVITVPHISQVHMFFAAELIDGKFDVGEESLEVKLFDETEIPWDELAFPSVTKSLKHFFEHRKRSNTLDTIEPLFYDFHYKPK